MKRKYVVVSDSHPHGDEQALLLRLPTGLIDRLDSAALQTNCSRSKIIREALNLALESEEFLAEK